MSRALTVCNERGCIELTPTSHCPEHTREPWAGSNRSARLPRDWQSRRQRVLVRDRHLCQVCRSARATEVDHIRHGDDHHPANLQAICSPCHKAKTAAEAAQARREATG